MTKRILLLLVSVALLCLLCGCECSHNWKAADCTTPETCTKCGITQGNPTGHFWMPSTCEIPETCQECGETQGEAGHKWKDATCNAPKTCQSCGLTDGVVLDHDYQFEKFLVDEMQYRCTRCSAVSKAPIDRALFIQTLLPGNWDLFAIRKGTSQISANNITGVGPYMTVTEEGIMQLYLEDGQVLEMNCEFVSYEEIEGVGTYTCELVNTADGSRYPAVLSDNAHVRELSVAISEGETIILQNHLLLQSFCDGKWYDFMKDQLYFMELNADRTFSANFNGGISGTWHIKPMQVLYNFDMFNLVLAYTKDDQQVCFAMPMYIAPVGEGLQALMATDGFRPTWNIRDKETNMDLSLYQTFTESEVISVNPEDAALILGEWTSSEVIRYIYETFSSTNEVTSEHTAVFREDGTFEVHMGNTVKGKWYYICTSSDNGSTYRQFTLKPDGAMFFTNLALTEYAEFWEWAYSVSEGMNYTQCFFRREK